MIRDLESQLIATFEQDLLATAVRANKGPVSPVILVNIPTSAAIWVFQNDFVRRKVIKFGSLPDISSQNIEAIATVLVELSIIGHRQYAARAKDGEGHHYCEDNGGNRACHEYLHQRHPGPMTGPN